MTDDVGTLSSRQRYSAERLGNIRDRIAGFQELRATPCLCIYVTGSYGRLEASENSDLDIFFIHQGSSTSDSIPRISKTLLDAKLIQLARELGFPEFSNDGEYLQVHYIDDILDELGGRKDDFKNHFTARLLLLLESQPLHNGDVYDVVMQRIIDSYYRDYHSHETSFRPVFLINDIIRFWRTMCLNYEHRRNRETSDDEKRNKNHLANLKLKFSRLLTCHSAIALISMNPNCTPTDLLDIFKISPLSRLDRIADRSPVLRAEVEKIRELYSWFLDRTGGAKDQTLEWIGRRDSRNGAFQRGREFANSVYDLIVRVTEGTESMRFLVV